MRDGVKAATDIPVRCPKCRREISPDSSDCPYCGAPVALIWEDCRVACYFLRLAAVFLLASLIAGVTTVVVTDSLGLTGLGIRNLAIISVIIAIFAIGMWKLSDALNPPPEPHQEIRGAPHRVRPRPPDSERPSRRHTGLKGRLDGGLTYGQGDNHLRGRERLDP